MRRFFIIVMSFILSIGVNAQELKRTEPDFSDYIPLLKAAGYEVYTFDISSLKDNTYNLSFVIREYAKGERVSGSDNDVVSFTVPSRRMISELPEASQRQLLAERGAYDMEKGIFKLAEKLSIGFSPSADSLKTMTLSVDNMGLARRNLALKRLDGPVHGREYGYAIRPFRVDTIRIGDFTPLLLIGSFWYDERAKIFRFCGEREFPADMSSETLKLVPHYYVVGIKLTQ